jgi:uncharacterized protein (DUF486 family)
MWRAALKFLSRPSILNLLVIVGTAVIEELLTEPPEVKAKKKL